MNYAKIRFPDVANGTGVRVSLFVSGCTHHCKGCFNKETWDFNYGKPFTMKEIDEILNILKYPYVQGLSVLGGEPFDNIGDVYSAIFLIKKIYPKKDIWVYTGYNFWEIYNDKFRRNLLLLIDVLVDGEFVEELKDLKLRFRGSSNQRIIDVKRSLIEEKVIEVELCP